MSKGRFEAIKKYIPYVFAKWDDKDTDPWWQVTGGVEGFNNGRKDKILSGYAKVMDELMSAFKPRTTATGNLPHLSFIQRKPEPFGTEFKAILCALTGMLLFIEIQRGKLPMRNAKYCDELKVTAATTMRLIEPVRRNESVSSDEVFLGDSWFASIDAAVNIKKKFQSNFIGVIKTSHAGYCKKYLEEKMKEWPAGSHLVLESTVNDVELLAIGYKYNKRKVACFIATKGAGHTEAGKPYEAKWKDENGNTRSRDVFRPEVIAKYFVRSNGIDVHNQTRQGDLRLEKHWVTNDGFFRIATTLFGLTVTDAWKGYTFHLSANHRHKKQGILEFASVLCRDLLENNCSPEIIMEDNSLVLNLTGNINNANINLPSIVCRDVNTAISPITEDSSAATKEASRHKCGFSDRWESYTNSEGRNSVRTGKRRKRGKCMICKVRRVSTICLGCKDCDVGEKRKAAWCCDELSVPPGKRSCIEIHREQVEKRIMDESNLVDV